MTKITIQSLTFRRQERDGTLSYTLDDPDTGITWQILRPACPDYCTPYWTCTVIQGTRIRSLTMFVGRADGTADIGPLYHDVPHGIKDPPMQLLGGVADMVHQRVDPFGPRTAPWTNPQLPCPFELGKIVRWKGVVYEITGREWRGRWLLTLVWLRNGGIVRDVPAHQVAPVAQPVSRQLPLL
jgi:hypothetical protein